MSQPRSARRTARTLINMLLVLTLALTLNFSVFAQSKGGGLRPDGASAQEESTHSLAVVKEGRQPAGPIFKTTSSGERLVGLIVRLEGEPLATYTGGVAGLAPTSTETTGTTELDLASQASQRYLSYLANRQAAFTAQVAQAAPDAQVTYNYSVVENGVALVLPESQVDAVKNLPGVVAVFVDELRHRDTDTGPTFIGAPTIWEQLGGQGSAGEGIVVGVVDSGIWPEHPSFSDPDPLGKAYAPPPGGPYKCEFGSAVPGDAAFTCNNKLIGAYRFQEAYDQLVGLNPGEFPSARDSDGHGTHTSTTAAGNAGVVAGVGGSELGVVSGVAPRAHVIMYRTGAGPNGSSYTSDLVAAVEQAIKDGVDVINYSISGGSDPYSDPVSLAFLKAYSAGVFVAASAGNNGPGADTVGHREPWTTTVAASSHTRQFVSEVTLYGDNGEEITLPGVTLTDGIDTPTAVVMAVDYGDELCLNPFPAGTFNGEIVVCKRGTNARVAKGYNVEMGGAGGMILYNPALQGLSTDNHFLPAIHIEVGEGAAMLDFIANHTGVTATFLQGTQAPAKGDVMASFSSRGGINQTLGISKPDVTAPGVQILAGHTPMPAYESGGAPGELFQAIQGTSMSSPHVAGSAALLKALHPDWTPGQIKSALMMTALTKNVVKEDGTTPSTPFDRGSGRVDLTRAGAAMLSISETAENFQALKSQLWHANYPSLFVPTMPGMIQVKRTVHSEVNVDTKWNLIVEAPADVQVLVPSSITVPAGGDATFDITVLAPAVPLGQARHADLVFKMGENTLHFPISFVRRQPVVTLEKSCDPASLAQGSKTTCTVKATNTSFSESFVSLIDRVPPQFKLVPGSVSGAAPLSSHTLVFEGSLQAAQPPVVGVAVDENASIAGYLPLASIGAGQAVSASDESISNYNVPAFVYGGETYTRIGIVSNGYIVIGGGASTDVKYANLSDFPNLTLPNNVLAPFWTDLDPSAGGRVLISVLSNAEGQKWIVVEWENVPNFSDGKPNSFQVWIGANGVNDIAFTYGTALSTGDPDAGLTVGAENRFGNSGGTVYFNGAGTPPAPSYPAGAYEVRVDSQAGAAGETHTVTFEALGKRVGQYLACTAMTSPAYFGANLACASGEVTPPAPGTVLGPELWDNLYLPLTRH